MEARTKCVPESFLPGCSVWLPQLEFLKFKFSMFEQKCFNHVPE